MDRERVETTEAGFLVAVPKDTDTMDRHAVVCEALRILGNVCVLRLR